MKKVLENINYISLAILSCTFLYTCNSNRTLKKIHKDLEDIQYTQIESLNKLEKIDSTMSDFKTLLEIEGYKISKRNLYYNNAIIRTTVRPDDVMHEYDMEIEKLSKKLK